MFGLTLAEWLWYGIGSLVALGGLGVAAWVLFRPRGPRGRHCPKCLYDMRSTKGMRCPECGQEARSERAMLRRRVRWRWAALGVLMMFIGVGVGGHGYARQQTHGWWSLMPTVVLVEAMGWGPRGPARALNERLKAGFSGRLLESAPEWSGDPVVPVWYERRAVNRAKRVLTTQPIATHRHFTSRVFSFRPPGYDMSYREINTDHGCYLPSTPDGFAARHLLMCADHRLARESLLWIALNGNEHVALWAVRAISDREFSAVAGEGPWTGPDVPIDPRWAEGVQRAIPGAMFPDRSRSQGGGRSWGSYSCTLFDTLMRIEPFDPRAAQACMSAVRDAFGDDAFGHPLVRVIVFSSSTQFRKRERAEEYSAQIERITHAMLSHPDAYWRLAGCYTAAEWFVSSDAVMDRLHEIEASDPDDRVRDGAMLASHALQREATDFRADMPFLKRWSPPDP